MRLTRSRFGSTCIAVAILCVLPSLSAHADDTPSVSTIVTVAQGTNLHLGLDGSQVGVAWVERGTLSSLAQPSLSTPVLTCRFCDGPEGGGGGSGGSSCTGSCWDAVSRVNYWVSSGHSSTSMQAEIYRTQGDQQYGNGVHATLIQGEEDGGNEVWDGYTSSCAQNFVFNGEADTCRSPSFGTHQGQVWTAAQGSFFDNFNDENGNQDNPDSQDGTCEPCVDTRYTA